VEKITASFKSPRAIGITWQLLCALVGDYPPEPHVVLFGILEDSFLAMCVFKLFDCG